MSNFDLNTRVPKAVMDVAGMLRQAGATRVCLVGGSVIDILKGITPKDFDLECFGMSYDQICQTLAHLSPKEVGASFGIVIVNHEGIDIDINVPRTDNKIGKGHTGFDVLFDPQMTVKEAARRRDFSINTLAVDVLTGELHDPFGGLADLHEGVLRATDPVLFVQDPLRALRAMQLLARKAKVVDPRTMGLIKGMVNEFDDLAGARVHEEWRKLLLKAERPSVGLEFLSESGWLQHFPELANLVGCEQNPEWHPEGDVWTHALLTVDAAAQLRHTVPDNQKEGFMFGALLHDIGKAPTTITLDMIERGDPWVARRVAKTGNSPHDLLLTAHEHDRVGGEMVKGFLNRFTESKKLIKLTTAIVAEHMQPYMLVAGQARKSRFDLLHTRMVEAGGDFELITKQCMCDCCASALPEAGRSLASGRTNWEDEISSKMYDLMDQGVGQEVIPDLVMGRHLQEATGVRGAKWFGPALKAAHHLQFEEGVLDFDLLLAEALKHAPATEGGDL
jgi:tRNA nucleotidyltransferase (CCA-adding enzyme)